MATRFREMAFLNKGLKITLTDEREEGKTQSFCYEGGIIDYVKFLTKGKETLNDPIYFSVENGDGSVEISMQ